MDIETMPNDCTNEALKQFLGDKEDARKNVDPNDIIKP